MFSLHFGNQPEVDELATRLIPIGYTATQVVLALISTALPLASSTLLARRRDRDRPVRDQGRATRPVASRE